MITLPASYTTVGQVLEALPSIGSVTNITSAVICGFIGRSEALVNAKVSKQYPLPFTQEVPLLQTLALDITLYNILAKRLYVGEQLSKSPWPDRYKEALDTLNEIADGSLPLMTASGTAIPYTSTAGGEMWSSTQDYPPTFTEDDMTLSLVDSYKIEVIRGERE